MKKIADLLRSKYVSIVVISLLYHGINQCLFLSDLVNFSHSDVYITLNNIIYLLLIPFFSLFYGIYSYRKTEKVVIPSLVLVITFPIVFWIAGGIFNCFYGERIHNIDPYDSFMGMALHILITAGISMGVSAMTQVIMYKNKGP